MQNSQSSNPTVAKLLEADADLAAQEIELNAQIQSIQEKRHSLKTVIDLFAPVATANNTLVTTSVTEEQLQPTVLEVDLPESNNAMTDITTENAIASIPPKRQAKKNSSPASSKQSKKSAPIKKPSQQTDTWQQYVRDEFNDATLSVAVAEVMQQQPEQVLEITTIIDAIFVDDIPKGHCASTSHCQCPIHLGNVLLSTVAASLPL